MLAVALRQGAIVRNLLLHGLKQLRGNDDWHRDGEPLRAVTFLSSRFRYALTFIPIHRADIRLVAENMMNARHAPPPFTILLVPTGFVAIDFRRYPLHGQLTSNRSDVHPGRYRLCPVISTARVRAPL